MIRLLAVATLVLVLVACGEQSASTTSPSPSQVSSSPSPIASPSSSPTTQLGPGGLTLDEEIGAVIMVGFQGQLTDAVLADWRQHQYGGLLVVNPRDANPDRVDPRSRSPPPHRRHGPGRWRHLHRAQHSALLADAGWGGE